MKKISYCNITSKTIKVSFSVVEPQEHKYFGGFSPVYEGYPWPKYQLKYSVAVGGAPWLVIVLFQINFHLNYKFS